MATMRRPTLSEGIGNSEGKKRVSWSAAADGQTGSGDLRQVAADVADVGRRRLDTAAGADRPFDAVAGR